MDDTWTVHYDCGTSTLELSGSFDHTALPAIREKVDRAHRRTPCLLTVDLTRTREVPPHTMGQLVHLCHSQYPGTFVRLPVVVRPSEPPFIPAAARTPGLGRLATAASGIVGDVMAAAVVGTNPA